MLDGTPSKECIGPEKGEGFFEIKYVELPRLLFELNIISTLSFMSKIPVIPKLIPSNSKIDGSQSQLGG